MRLRLLSRIRPLPDRKNARPRPPCSPVGVRPARDPRKPRAQRCGQREGVEALLSLASQTVERGAAASRPRSHRLGSPPEGFSSSVRLTVRHAGAAVLRPDVGGCRGGARRPRDGMAIAHEADVFPLLAHRAPVRHHRGERVRGRRRLCERRAHALGVLRRLGGRASLRHASQTPSTFHARTEATRPRVRERLSIGARH